MHKFGLLILLANIILKLGLGIGLWKIAMEYKSGLSSSTKYNEEQINDGNPEILRGPNNNNNNGRIFPTGEGDNNIDLKVSQQSNE